MCDITVRGLECDEPARWRYRRAEKAILTGIRKLDVGAVLGHANLAASELARETTLAGQLGWSKTNRFLGTVV